MCACKNWSRVQKILFLCYRHSYFYILLTIVGQIVNSALFLETKMPTQFSIYIQYVYLSSHEESVAYASWAMIIYMITWCVVSKCHLGHLSWDIYYAIVISYSHNFTMGPDTIFIYNLPIYFLSHQKIN